MNKTTNLFVLLIVISFILPATAIRYAQAATENSQESNRYLETDRRVVAAVVEMNNSRVVVLEMDRRVVGAVVEMNSNRVVVLEMDRRVVGAVVEMNNSRVVAGTGNRQESNSTWKCTAE